MLIFSIIALTGLFLISIVLGMYYGFGARHYWFFETLHFLGGFFVAMFLYNFTGSTVLILIGLAIITFLWELSEYLISQFRKSANYMKKTFHLKSVAINREDTILDIILNFSGATVFIIIKFLF